jgi:hypothetical protein
MSEKKKPMFENVTLAERLDKIKTELGKEQTNSTADIVETTTANDANETKPKLFVNGRLDRKTHKYINCSLAVLADVYADIKKYCHGGENAIFNYLLIEGLKNVKAFNTIASVDKIEIENYGKK